MIHKDAIRKIIDDTDHLAGKVFAFTIQTLIVVSLATFSFGTLPDLSSKTKEILYVIEVITVTIFTFEYILRIIVAEEKNNLYSVFMVW